MKIKNGQIAQVLESFESLLDGVRLPVADAITVASLLTDLTRANEEVQRVEAPLFDGKQEINLIDENGDPVEGAAVTLARIAEIRDEECTVNIPVFKAETLTGAGGEISPLKITTLLFLGIIERPTEEDAA